MILGLFAALAAVYVVSGLHPRHLNFAEARGVVVRKYAWFSWRDWPGEKYYLVIKDDNGKSIEVPVTVGEYRKARVGSRVSLGRPGTIISP